MSINSLPPVSDEMIQAMNTAAEKKMAKDGIAPVVETQPEIQASVVENPPQLETPEPETTPELSAQPTHEPTKPSTTPQESWKILRQKAEQAERRAQELEAALLQAQNLKPNQPQPTDEPLEDISLEADALVEGKHLSKVSKHIKRLESQIQQYQQQAAVSSVEVKLKSQYADFDSVVTKENLENLKATYPEIAHTINSSNDLYSKAVSAYTMIKKLGIGQVDDFAQEKELAQKNAAKPKPLASVSPQRGNNALDNANAFASGKLTDELKAQLRKEMHESAKQW